MTKTQNELMGLMVLVSTDETTQRTNKLFLTLCLSELMAFSDDASVQDSVQNMLDIVKDE